MLITWCKYTIEFIVYAIQWERYSFKLLIFVVCFPIDGLIQLCDYRVCVFVILHIGAISVVTFLSGVFSRVPFDWVPFRSVHFHRYSVKSATLLAGYVKNRS